MCIGITLPNEPFPSTIKKLKSVELLKIYYKNAIAKYVTLLCGPSNVTLLNIENEIKFSFTESYLFLTYYVASHDQPMRFSW